jgi:hypothetical protein
MITDTRTLIDKAQSLPFDRQAGEANFVDLLDKHVAEKRS